MTLRKLILTVFFASVVINAVLGIVALFATNFDETQTDILLTSLTISTASVLSLAMFPARERGLVSPIPSVGIGLTILGFGLFLVLIWTDFDEYSLAKLAASFLVMGIAAGYVSLVALAVINPKFFNIVRGAYILATILAGFVVGAIWGEPEGEFLLRLMGVISILLAAATVTIPVLHRIYRNGATTMSGPSLKRVPSRCVSCGAQQLGTIDGLIYACGACQTRFRSDILI